MIKDLENKGGGFPPRHCIVTEEPKPKKEELKPAEPAKKEPKAKPEP